MSNSIFPALAAFLPRLPLLLICIAGVAIALANWNNHRKPAILVLSASAAMLLGLGLGLLSQFVAINRAHSGESTMSIANTLVFLGIFQSLCSAAAFGLLLVAAFIGRNLPPVPPRA